MDTVLAGFTAALVDYGVAKGLARPALLAAAGISEHELTRADERLSQQQSTAIWEGLIDGLRDPNLGLHLAESLNHPKSFGVMGYLTRAAPTMRDALKSVVRFHRTLGLRSAGFDEGGTAGTLVFRVLDRSPEVARQNAEATMGAVVLMAQRTALGPVRPQRVSFEHGKPKSIAEHRRLFGCPVTFGQPMCRLELGRDALDARFTGADRTLQKYLAQLAEQRNRMLAPGDNLLVQVDHVIQSALPKGPTLRTIGKALALSPRTLQRRLKDEGRTFNAMVDEVRRRLATGLLEHGLSVSEVGQRVGFRDANAFRRAFKRWTKLAPSRFRASLHA